MDLVRPPHGYRLDLAVLTTYTLDLETLLALPFAVVAHSDGGVDKLLEDPLLLLQGLREAGERIHVFVDGTGIAAPGRQRELYATLEQSVHPVRPTGGGVFHPKVWLVRFVDQSDEDDVLIRVAVLSRNLTFDRSWDVALASEARPQGRQVAASGALGRLVRDLEPLSTMPLAGALVDKLKGLSEGVWRCSFAAPDEFENSPITFHATGLESSRRWRPHISNGKDVLAIAPFVRTGGLEAIRRLGVGKGVLISRPEELAGVSQNSLDCWGEVRILADTASDEDEDGDRVRPSGLHAKLVAVEHGWDVTWFLGSANLTPSALEGRNVEVMAQVTGRRSRVGIKQFMEGFDGLCESYRPPDDGSDEESADVAAELLDTGVRALAESGLRISCHKAGDLWEWRLTGEVAIPPSAAVDVWPVSVSQDQARVLSNPVSIALPKSRLTAFAAFRLYTSEHNGEERRIALKLPMTGAPRDRAAEILRSLIDSPERFMAFLRALLAGVEGLGQLGDREDAESGGEPWRDVFEDERLLEDMLRTASQNPDRLATVRKLISDLKKTKEGRAVVPKPLLDVWQAVEVAIDRRKDGSGE